MDIDDLYALIPEVGCPAGCVECCTQFGVPSRTPVEDRRIRQYLARQGRTIGTARGTCCPYVTATGCSIYPVRPFTCRLYGASVNYRCKKGVVPLQPLEEDMEAELLHLYQEHFVRPADKGSGGQSTR